jgi:hypothetical protein
MSESVKPALLTMDESLFCRLLEGPGRVQVDIVKLQQYFVPIVSFYADDESPCVQYGAIVRGKSDLLAAKTEAELVVFLRDIAGESSKLEICLPPCPARAVGSSPNMFRRAVSPWLL